MTTIKSKLLVLALPFMLGGIASAQVGIGAVQSDERRNTLNDLAAHKLTLPPTELETLLRGALSDEDPDIRQRGLWVVSGRAGVLRFAPTDENRATWRAERSVLVALRPRILESLSEPTLKVRLAAIAALGNLDYAPGVSGVRAVSISASTAHALARMYLTEPSPAARAEAMKAFALLTPPQTHGFEPETLATIAAGLSDQNADVVQIAALGVGNLRMRMLLPKVAVLLKSESKGVRLAAAQSIGAFGPQAAQYAADVEDAVSQETDPVMRQALQNVGKRLRGGH